MEDLEKIKLLEKEIELLREIIRLKDEQRQLAQPIYIPQPYPVYPQPQPYNPPWVQPWPNYPQPYIGDPFLTPSTTCGSAPIQ